MPDINQLFELHQLAHQRALNAADAHERADQRLLAQGYAQRLDAVTYPQPGSFLLD